MLYYRTYILVIVRTIRAELNGPVATEVIILIPTYLCYLWVFMLSEFSLNFIQISDNNNIKHYFLNPYFCFNLFHRFTSYFIIVFRYIITYKNPWWRTYRIIEVRRGEVFRFFT